MGCGASSKRYAKQVDISEEAPCGATEPDTFASYEGQARPSANSAQRRCAELDSELKWLRKVIDQEKAEKEWLMKRFESVQKELSTRNDELMAIHRQQHVPLSPQLSPQPLEVPLAPHVANAANVRAGSPASASRPTNLSDRRGFQLGIVTAKPAGGVPEAAPAPAPAAQPAQPLRITAPSLEPATLASQRRVELMEKLESNQTPVEPLTDSFLKGRGRARTWCGDAVPMSPLLRRRTNWEPTPGALTITSSSPNLQVDATKIVSLDEMVPASPKRRAPRTPKNTGKDRPRLYLATVNLQPGQEPDGWSSQSASGAAGSPLGKRHSAPPIATIHEASEPDSPQKVMVC
eukprot:gnl/TRDRNA2_/TRDRNA2_158354_c0_seq2.p1 gnl/TRDRNA2_/TRDRNA2_158354_c0~~gnl/TRDRNA2_/TRDRNA2_158354_c0_seq2.p1  ORF type:complete len:348 (-),score=57.68 gnl/TRDRNA2_/TRDRNA2_158354_c0_seq2:45-1088(-)